MAFSILLIILEKRKGGFPQPQIRILHSEGPGGLMLLGQLVSLTISLDRLFVDVLCKQFAKLSGKSQPRTDWIFLYFRFCLFVFGSLMAFVGELIRLFGHLIGLFCY